MWSRLPLLCVETCNPICCLCMTPPGSGEVAGGEDGQATTGKVVFAHASSVLTNAAEEIHLGGQLDNELASEVELWRMESNGRDGFAGLAEMHRGESRGRVIALYTRERSLSPPPRTQVSLHDRIGCTANADGSFLGTGRRLRKAKDVDVPPQAQRAGDDADAAAGASGKAGVASTSHPIPDSAADAAAGCPKSQGSGEQAAGCPRPQRSGEQRGRERVSRPTSASRSASPKPPGEGFAECSEPAGADGPCSAAAAAAALGADVAADLATVRVAEAAAAVALQAKPVSNCKSTQLVQLARARVARQGHATPSAFSSAVASGTSCSRPDSRGLRRLPHQWGESESSSEESTFAGFIEDPLEKERTESQYVWLGDSVESRRM